MDESRQEIGISRLWFFLPTRMSDERNFGDMSVPHKGCPTRDAPQGMSRVERRYLQITCFSSKEERQKEALVISGNTVRLTRMYRAVGRFM